MTAELEFEMLERLVSEKEKRIRDNQSTFDELESLHVEMAKKYKQLVMDHNDEKADEIHIEMQSVKSKMNAASSRIKLLTEDNTNVIEQANIVMNKIADERNKLKVEDNKIADKCNKTIEKLLNDFRLFNTQREKKYELDDLGSDVFAICPELKRTRKEYQNGAYTITNALYRTPAHLVKDDELTKQINIALSEK